MKEKENSMATKTTLGSGTNVDSNLARLVWTVSDIAASTARCFHSDIWMAHVLVL